MRKRFKTIPQFKAQVNSQKETNLAFNGCFSKKNVKKQFNQFFSNRGYNGQNTLQAEACFFIIKIMKKQEKQTGTNFLLLSQCRNKIG